MRENFPIDPDSVFDAEDQMPPATSDCGDGYIEKLVMPPKKSCGCDCPRAKADARNERYAVFIRSCFCGRRSELTLMTGYLYQSVRFACCSDELCAVLYRLAQSKLKYLKLLGDLLCSLGSDPKYLCSVSPNAIAGSWWNASPSVLKYPPDLGEALCYSIAAEKELSEEYKNIAAYVDDEGIKSALTEILSEKECDIKDLSLLYTRFCS